MDLERGKRQTTAANLTALRTALEATGVAFWLTARLWMVALV
jgi:hypothetical protein